MTSVTNVLLVQPMRGRAERSGVGKRSAFSSFTIGRAPLCFALAACLFASACTSATLVPVSAEDGIASVQQGQLELRAEVQSGSHDVPDTITPIQIWVHNSSATGVYVALHDISLVANGSAAEPLEPSELRPRPLGLGLDPASPFVASSQGAVGAAPVPESGMGAPPSPYPNARDSEPLDPQRRALQSGAFEGGFIAPGATERGMIYFRAPTRSGEKLTLRVRIRSGDGVPLQVLEIPYTLES
jgi:hypothetical protein